MFANSTGGLNTFFMSQLFLARFSGFRPHFTTHLAFFSSSIRNLYVIKRWQHNPKTCSFQLKPMHFINFEPRELLSLLILNLTTIFQIVVDFVFRNNSDNLLTFLFLLFSCRLIMDIAPNHLEAPQLISGISLCAFYLSFIKILFAFLLFLFADSVFIFSYEISKLFFRQRQCA